MSLKDSNRETINLEGNYTLLTPSHDSDLNNRFMYHAPKEGQPEKYEKIRRMLLEVAKDISTLCPPSRERALAITKLEEAMMWANASIARNE